MTTETPACIFSASKAVTAMVIHLLDERRQLHIGDRVSEYIPEYAQNGKEGTTIAHVLAHRAGVASMPKEALDLDSIDDWDRIVRLICEDEAVRPPRPAARLPRGLGRVHPRRDRPAGDRKDRPGGPRRGDPGPAGVQVGQLRRRARGRRAGRPRLRDRAASAPAALHAGQAGARVAARRGGRALERPPLPDRAGAVRERGHDGERAARASSRSSGREGSSTACG